MNDQWIREFEHTGDLGIEITAPSRGELFHRAAIAMAGLMVDTARVVECENREIQIAAISNIDLMHDVLSKLLGNVHHRRLHLVGSGGGRRAYGVETAVGGRSLRPRRHEYRTEIKAVTYHELAVTQQQDGSWRARIIFDI